MPYNYIFDWNVLKKPSGPHRYFEVLDETLRDGLQSPSVLQPSLEDKIKLLHLMAKLGIQAVDLGLPASSKRAYTDTLALAQEIATHRLPLKPMCAARTAITDIAPIAKISQHTGLPIEVYAFVGSSPVRLETEGWSVEMLLRWVEESSHFSLREDLPYCLVTEDTTRSRPDVLDPLFRTAIRFGVKRLCLCDTVGYATPQGVYNLFDWTQALVRGMGEDILLDWHGHNDRGLGVVNVLCALEVGADRVHGSGLGIGERVGNAAIDQILMNLKIMDVWDCDLSALVEYCNLISTACGVQIPNNYPLAGRDAFRTATGVHAAAILKSHDHVTADTVYSGVPARWFGREQEVEIGPMSGASNVVYWLKVRRMEEREDLVKAILAKAKAASRVLKDEEIMDVVQRNHRS
jgi:2-isopropylmalate synthase